MPLSVRLKVPLPCKTALFTMRPPLPSAPEEIVPTSSTPAVMLVVPA